MRPRAFSPYPLLHGAMLRTAALLVPAHERREWLREWSGELWHVRQTCVPACEPGHKRAQREVTAFCLGAFQDALCVRRFQDALGVRGAAGTGSAPAAPAKGTPRDCLLALAIVLAASYAVALLLPGVRAERSLWPRPASSNLVLIQLAAAEFGPQPTVMPQRYRSWQAQSQRFFEAFAFYRVESEAAEFSAEPGASPDYAAWHVANASANLLPLLGLPVEFAAPELRGDTLPAVILSERTWKRDFGADPHVSGLVMRVGQRLVRVAGVAPDGGLALPGDVDAWDLDSARTAASSLPGFVIGRLTPLGKSMMWSRSVRIGSGDSPSEDEDFLGVALDQSQPATRTVYFFALLLALLALPAITTVSLGESSTSPHQTSWPRRLFRWSFFAAKAALLLPIVYFVSIDLAYGFTTLSREHSIYIQLAATFGMCLFSLRWALKDQRQRCPVCMRLVTHPAQVGQASRTFLDWNGTEMMCMGGHTLLHVPSLPTSWFGAQRWLYLDTSWDFLFAGSTRPAP